MKDENWNIILGCTPVNAGCDNCPGERAAYLSVVCDGKWTNKIDFIDFMKKRLDQPLHWRKPRRIWLGKIGDIFQPGVKDEWLDQIFAVMALCPQHMFYIQTKRPERAKKYFSDGKDWCDGANRAYDQYIRPLSEDMFLMGEIVWPLPNVRIGVVVEDQKRANDLVPKLLEVPAAKRFVSIEPMLGSVKLRHMDVENAGHKEWCFIDSLTGKHTDMGRPCPDVPHLDLVITGGETGPGSRPMHPDWVRKIRDDCQAADVKFVFRGWGDWKEGWYRDYQARCVYSDGRSVDITREAIMNEERRSGKDHQTNHPTAMSRVGKKRSGHLIDGIEYWEWPE